MSKSAPEFDHQNTLGAAQKEFPSSSVFNINDAVVQRHAFIDGARWQFSQDRVKIAALEAEVERYAWEHTQQVEFELRRTEEIRQLKSEASRLDKIAESHNQLAKKLFNALEPFKSDCKSATEYEKEAYRLCTEARKALGEE